MTTNNAINNTVQNNDFSVNRSLAGTDVVSSVIHSDNTNTASNANLLAQTGGGSGGDPFIRFDIPSGQDYSIGIDNSDSDSLKIQDDANPSTGNTLWKMTSAGERTMPLQPAFYAYNSAAQTNVTGTGVTYTVHFDSTVYDQNSDFNTGTYTFIAPVTGKYLLIASLKLEDVAADETNVAIAIVTTNRSYRGSQFSPAAGKTSANIIVVTANAIADMAASHSATVTIYAANGAGATIDLSAGATENFFMGTLLV